MRSYEVCWTCRGLIVGGKPGTFNIKRHAALCVGSENSKDSSVFDYFVCDRKDYLAMKCFQKDFSKDNRLDFLLSTLEAVVTPNVLQAFAALCISNVSSEPPITPQVTSNTTGKCDQFSQTQLCTTDENENCPVEDKTFIRSERDSNGNTILSDSHKLSYASWEEEALDFVGQLDSETQIEVCAHKNEINCTVENALQQVDRFSTLSRQQNEVNTPISQNTGQSVTDSTNNAVTESISNKISYLLSDEKKKLATECQMKRVGSLTYFSCKLCSYQTKSDKLMLRHMSSHNEGKDFKCSKCQFSSIWRMEWQQHLKRCSGQEQYQCHICSQRFARKDKLNKHLKAAHPECGDPAQSLKSKLQCDQCEYIGRSLSCLKEHRKKHTGETLRCPHMNCDFESFYQRSLNKHLSQKHSEEKSRVCSVCGFQTRHMSSLTKHMMLHETVKKYKCAQCSYTAFTPSQILDHARRKHLKQKLYSCPKCSFKTSYPMGIKKHIQRHESSTSFFCSICEEALESMRKAKQHMARVHKCADYKIINESLEKINPRDYEIKNKDNDIEKSLKFVVVIDEEQAKTNALPTDVMNVDINSNAIFDMATDIINAEVHAGSTTEDLLEPSLHPTPDIYNNETQPSSSKGRNPMLSATSNDLGDGENSLIENSLFDLMTDFPRPPNLNRCQSASTLMFTSFSPHLIDRPLTPDFFSDSPSSTSFFPAFSTKSLEHDSLPLGNLTSFEAPSQTFANSSSIPKVPNGHSPVLPSFLVSPGAGNLDTQNSVVHMADTLVRTSPCAGIESILPSSVFSPVCTPNKLPQRNSAFLPVVGDFPSVLPPTVSSITEGNEMEVHGSQVGENPYAIGAGFEK